MTDTKDGEWFGGQRWTGYAAIGVVAILLLCVGFLIYTHTSRGSGANRAATAATTSARAAAGTPAAAIPSTSPPGGISWDLIGGYAVPTSPVDGPSRVQGTVAAGFAPTPTGALLALVNAQLRLTVASGNKALCAAEVAAAFERTAAAGALATTCATPGGPAERYQVAGYSFLAYTPEQATISYAIRDEQTAALIQITGTLTWTGQDWAVTLPGAAGNGNPLGPTAVIQSLAGLVTWAGA